jgi:4-carboxymuconolactone decarboxylase
MEIPMSRNIGPSARYPIIKQEDWTDDQHAAAQALIATPRGEVRGPFIPLLYSATLLDRVQRLGEFLRYECSIEQRLREVAILATAVRWNQGYEWEAHVRHAHQAGVTLSTVNAIASDGNAAEAPLDEQEVIDFCRELHRTQRVSNITHDAIVSRHGRAGAVELTAMCGYYSLLAMVLNVAEIGDPDSIASVR